MAKATPLCSGERAAWFVTVAGALGSHQGNMELESPRPSGKGGRETKSLVPAETPAFAA